MNYMDYIIAIIGMLIMGAIVIIPLVGLFGSPIVINFKCKCKHSKYDGLKPPKHPRTPPGNAKN